MLFSNFKSYLKYFQIMWRITWNKDLLQSAFHLQNGRERDGVPAVQGSARRFEQAQSKHACKLWMLQASAPRSFAGKRRPGNYMCYLLLLAMCNYISVNICMFLACLITLFLTITVGWKIFLISRYRFTCYLKMFRNNCTKLSAINNIIIMSKVMSFWNIKKYYLRIKMIFSTLFNYVTTRTWYRYGSRAIGSWPQQGGGGSHWVIPRRSVLLYHPFRKSGAVK